MTTWQTVAIGPAGLPLDHPPLIPTILVGNLMFLNLSLFVFNLLPFPPLDGSKILGTFLPPSAQPIINLFEQYGYLILMLLIYIGVFQLIITPFLYGLIFLLTV